MFISQLRPKYPTIVLQIPDYLIMFEIVFIAVLVVVVTAYLLKYFKQFRKIASQINKLPGPKTYPIFGSSLEFSGVPPTKRLQHYETLAKKYGYLFRSWWGSAPLVHILNAEDAEVLLSSQRNINKSINYKAHEIYLGTGLLTASGSKWHARRKMLTPTFHFSILKTFLPIFVESAQGLLHKLESEVNQNDCDIASLLKICTFDIICETAMGVKLDTESDESSKYIKSVERMDEIVISKKINPWFWIEQLYALTKTSKEEAEALQIFHTMALEVIQQRKLERIQHKLEEPGQHDEFATKRRKAFLDMMLDIAEESNIQMSDEDIREEVATFLDAGHDTTAASMALVIYFLGAYPDIQNKVVEELSTVFGTSDRTPTMDDLSELKYLECVIKETFRIFPVVPTVERTISEDTMFGGNLIPAGTMIEVNIFGLHRNPKYYPNPEVFDPDRFLPENNAKRHPFAFIPFSAGPRNCIGKKFAMIEQKALLSLLLRKYKITSLQTLEELRLVPEVLLRPENGVRIKISPRIQ